ncbi:MAG: DNA polymerase III subunit delta [Oscillospiraceae bacterium]|nr:DNA polymerase III subunit delta [Oscillospiraceae bacterium]
MPPKNKGSDGYKAFTDALKSDDISCFYIFHGEERYLLQRCIAELRLHLCPDGLSSFNYKKYEGKHCSLDELDEAINTLPSFANRTFIEVHDFDLFSCDDKPRLSKMLSDLPEYVCILFVFDVVLYKPDRRVKINTEILKRAEVIEFLLQDHSKLVKWIRLHFNDAGKNISVDDAKYLAFLTGGYMSTLYGEIGKVAAFSVEDTIMRSDIDAVVSPVIDTAAYKLTDAVARRDFASATRIMDELLQMKEAPHKLLFSISLKMRQLLAARICIESKLSKKELIEICGLKYEFHANALWDTARKMTLNECKQAVLNCAEAAHELNSSSYPESGLTKLLTKLAFK